MRGVIRILVSFGLLFSLLTTLWTPVSPATAQTSQDCDPRVVALHQTSLFQDPYNQWAMGATITHCKIVADSNGIHHARIRAHWPSNTPWQGFPSPGVIRNISNHFMTYYMICNLNQETPDPFQPQPQSWPCKSSYNGDPRGPGWDPTYTSDINGWFDAVVTPPTVNLIANPSEVQPGGDSTLNWTSQNARELVLDHNIGNVAVPSGNRLISNIQETTTYTIKAYGYGGVTTKSATIAVLCQQTGPNGWLPKLFSRVQAQNQQCLPDLIPDISSIQVQTIDSQNVVRTVRPANFGRDIKTVVIKNLKVKNIGTAKATGILRTTLDLDGSEIYLEELAINLIPNSSVTLPEVKFGISEEDFPRMDSLYHTALSAANLGGTSITTVFKVDAKDFETNEDVFDESNEGNNSAEINPFLQFPAIQVKVSDSTNGNPLALTRVEFKNGGDAISSVTDQEGYAWLAPTNSVHKPTTYAIEAFLGPHSLGAAQNVSVQQNLIYKKSFTTSDWLIIAPRIFTYEDDGNSHPYTPTTGKIELEKVDDKGLRLSVPVTNGIAALSSRHIPRLTTGEYQLISGQASIDYLDNKQKESISFVVPEPTRKDKPDQDPDDPPRFAYTIGQITNDNFEFWIRKECMLLPAISHEVCWEEDEEHTKQSKEKLLSLWESRIKLFKGWSQSPAPAKFDLLRVASVIGDGWVAFYDYKNYVFIENRFALRSLPQDVINTIDHEMFHLIDDYYQQNSPPTFLSEKQDYIDRLKKQLSDEEVGLPLWDLALYNCAYLPGECIAGYSGEVDLDPVEALAEEKSVVCTYKEQVTNRLKNIESYWEQKIGPLTPENRRKLREQRDSVLKRFVGINMQGQTAIPEYKAWHNQCLQP